MVIIKPWFLVVASHMVHKVIMNKYWKKVLLDDWGNLLVRIAFTYIAFTLTSVPIWMYGFELFVIGFLWGYVICDYHQDALLLKVDEEFKDIPPEKIYEIIKNFKQKRS
jgi:hypothetical protein